METTMRKIGHSVGAIIPRELNPTVGDRYKIIKIGDTFVMTPVQDDLFSNESDWTGFRDSRTNEDTEWDAANKEITRCKDHQLRFMMSISVAYNSANCLTRSLGHVHYQRSNHSLNHKSS